MAPPVSTQVPSCEILIHDQWRESQATEFSPVTNPATGEVLARLAPSTRGEVDPKNQWRFHGGQAGDRRQRSAVWRHRRSLHGRTG